MSLRVRRHLLFAVFTAGLVPSSGGVLQALADLSRNNATASHHLLIPFVTLVLVFMRRDSVFTEMRSSWLAGAALILAGLVLALLGATSSALAHNDALSIEVAA